MHRRDVLRSTLPALAGLATVRPPASIKSAIRRDLRRLRRFEAETARIEAMNDWSKEGFDRIGVPIQGWHDAKDRILDAIESVAGPDLPAGLIVDGTLLIAAFSDPFGEARGNEDDGDVILLRVDARRIVPL